MKQEIWDHIDIRWAICRSSAPRSRQITCQHHRFFTGRMLFLMPNQQCQSTFKGKRLSCHHQTSYRCIVHGRPLAFIELRSRVQRSRSQGYQMCYWHGSACWRDCLGLLVSGVSGWCEVLTRDCWLVQGGRVSWRGGSTIISCQNASRYVDKLPFPYLCWLVMLHEPSHRVCKPAYLVPVPSQFQLWGLCQKGRLAWKWWGWKRWGHPLVWMGWQSIILDCWYVCLCYLHFAPENPEDGKMYLTVPAQPGCPGHSPQSCKMVVCMCV